MTLPEFTTQDKRVQRTLHYMYQYVMDNSQEIIDLKTFMPNNISILKHQEHCISIVFDLLTEKEDTLIEVFYSVSRDSYDIRDIFKLDVTEMKVGYDSDGTSRTYYTKDINFPLPKICNVLIDNS